MEASILPNIEFKKMVYKDAQGTYNYREFSENNNNMKRTEKPLKKKLIN